MSKEYYWWAFACYRKKIIEQLDGVKSQLFLFPPEIRLNYYKKYKGYFMLGARVVK